ncbi:MAG: hypothetical protein JRG89_23125, partial [Deltaproteobacteria bacterium]|nr:hypothetical protein [Deltaproteobacteria bacterium]
ASADPALDFDRSSLLLAAGGAAAILKVALVYSYSSHLGALGLDTHQHIYWTRQILDAHHLPLVERGTSILALYPRAFHVLTALWSAAGVAGPIGPWIKLMPFLQAFLPCMVFAELVRVQVIRSPGRRSHGLLLAALLIGALLVYAFGLTRMVYPEYDLGGTPRFASGAALLFPYLLFIAGDVLQSATLRRLSWLVLPAVALLLLALNAVLVVQLVIFVVPLLLISRGLSRANDASPRPLGRLLLALITLGLPLAIAIGDPWIVSLWSAKLGHGGRWFLDLFGLMTPDQAASFGLLSKDELVLEKPGPVLYSSVGDFLRLAVASLANGARGWMTTGWRFPFSDDLFSDPGRIIIRLGMIASAVFAMNGMRNRSNAQRTGEDQSAMRLWCGIALAGSLGGFAQMAMVHFTEGLAVGRGYEFVLLRNYCEIAARHVGLVAQGMILLAGIGWAVAVLSQREAREDPKGRRAKPWTIAGLSAVAMLLPFLLYGLVEPVDPTKSFWTPVFSQDLEHLREIESQIGDADGVMVPSNTWGIGGERWIIPQGPTASVLPFTTRRILFNSRLGAGVLYNWRDLGAFCLGSNRERAEFLARNDVRWFLLKGPESASETFYRKFRMCKLPLAAIGVVYPPAHHAGDLSLYRIDPRALGSRTE